MEPSLCGGVGTVERIDQLDLLPALLSQLALVLLVEEDQLRQRGELLPAVEIVEVSRVLNLDVSDLVPASNS